MGVVFPCFAPIFPQPTNHLDVGAVAWLREYLTEKLPGARRGAIPPRHAREQAEPGGQTLR